MGKEFGNLERFTGVHIYSLSPNEIRPFKGYLFPGISNWVKFNWRSGSACIVPVLFGIMIYKYCKEEHHRVTRKNLDNFKDEE